jgi:two-component system, NarL family, response regulator NreC
MNRKITVLIADDHALVREGIRLLINSQADMEVLNTVSDADAAVAQALKLYPQVVLLDVSMPGGGLKALVEMKRQAPEIRVIMLTMHGDVAYVRSALIEGAEGYILKKSAHSELLRAIRAVAAGGRHFDPGISELLLPNDLKTPRPLSDREKDTLRLLATGYTNLEIAGQLNLSVKTVEFYRARIMAKLKLKNRAELVQYAMRAGLLSID